MAPTDKRLVTVGEIKYQVYKKLVEQAKPAEVNPADWREKLLDDVQNFQGEIMNHYRVSFLLNGTRMSTLESGFSRSEVVERVLQNFPSASAFEVFDIQ